MDETTPRTSRRTRHDLSDRLALAIDRLTGPDVVQVSDRRSNEGLVIPGEMSLSNGSDPAELIRQRVVNGSNTDRKGGIKK